MAEVRVQSLEGRVPGESIRVLTLDNPPVNALSFAFSEKLLAALQEAHDDATVKTVIFAGANGLFSGGADVNDFNSEPQPDAKTIRDVIGAVERSDTVHVAAIDGNALGGGLELALACDYRIATRRSKVGLPEIKLGLLPGAGGTQRLPRLIGAQAALEFMLKGRSHSAERALELGILDEVVDDDAGLAAIAVAKRAGNAKRRVSQRTAVLGKGIPVQAGPYLVSQAHKLLPPERNGGFAAHKLVDAVEAAIELPFAFGIAREARLFEELVRSAPSSALRHLFFAERELAKIPGLPSAQPHAVAKAGVVGAGTMGSGIAIAFAQAGIPVTVVDSNDEAVDKARQTVMGMFMYQVQKGKLTAEEAWQRGQSIVFADDLAALGDADVVIEAVFEDMSVKKDVFEKLDAVVKPEAILATNTSTLDVDAMAAVTRRPERFVGLHFFVPANIMPLLEIVRGAKTSAETLATAFALGKRLRKTAVVSGNAFGFIGNRMVFDYAREAIALAEDGVAPSHVDAVMKDFGFPMGPFAMSDLSGIDVAWHIAKSRGAEGQARTPILDRLVERKRLGQKTQAGFFHYEKAVGKGREPIPDPKVEALFAEEARKAGIVPRHVTDDEIRDRLLYALINRGAYLLEQGVALRPGDIDIVYVFGYGFPPHHGGPMWYADEAGVDMVFARIVEFREAFGDAWTPAPLIAKIAAQHGTFAANPAVKELVGA
ncbi:MAG: enoyl-CoA hydratase/isomerase family protein [Candidatus Eremiobacteraeota bacterium]|nr:enoyl-CoA hydratase/isomerase family protein [Candidatus Eremiobacteraeota bacterium]MBV8372809.1 enoyl-CoA hydratase/isomerase family protein [Candidatus Eremiobacteraeota bacterium]